MHLPSSGVFRVSLPKGARVPVPSLNPTRRWLAGEGSLEKQEQPQDLDTGSGSTHGLAHTGPTGITGLLVGTGDGDPQGLHLQHLVPASAGGTRRKMRDQKEQSVCRNYAALASSLMTPKNLPKRTMSSGGSKY